MAGKIIKSTDAMPLGTEPISSPSRPAAPRRAVVDSEEYEAHTRARDIVAEAEAQAQQIRARAQEERQATLAHAREAGREEGLAQVTEVLARARMDAGRALAQHEPELVKLSIKVAERIIGRELEISQDAIMQIVAKAVEQLRQNKELVLRVSPDDAESLRTNKRRLMEQVGRLKDIAIREDPDVRRGGCVIETENGTVDAQLQTQLELIERALLGERG